MATSTIDIKNSIVTKLQAMQSINTVYNYDTSNFNGNYPVAVVTVGDGEGEVRANVRTLTGYSYNIDIFQELGSNFSPQKTERVVAEVLDEVLTAFRMDNTLSGTVTYCDQVTWTTGFEDREHDTRVLRISLTCRKIETIA